MARANQETVTTFGEVLHSANISYSQNRMNTPDNRKSSNMSTGYQKSPHSSGD